MDEELRLELTLVSNGYIVNAWGNINGHAFIQKCIASDIRQATNILIELEAEYRALGMKSIGKREG